MALSEHLHETSLEEEELAAAADFVASDDLLTLDQEVTLRGVMKKREASYRNGFRQRAVVELALYTGAKVNELERMTCGDVFLEPTAHSLRIPSETNPRVLPLSPEMGTFLAEYLEKKRDAGESTDATAPLVCSQLGSKLTLRGWQAAWALAQRHSGLVDGEDKARFNLEVARRVVGRRLYRVANNPHHVQAWLGLDITSNADRYRPDGLEVNVETLRPLVEEVVAPVDLRIPDSPSLRLAMAYYNGTIGVMNRILARRLFLDNPPEDPRREMWVARGLSRGRVHFPENYEMGERKAHQVIAAIAELVQQGDPMATFLYASAHDEGLGVKRDYEKSAELYQKAMDMGVETAITNLALKYHWGTGVPQDDQKALELFHRGAALHEASCMFNLALMTMEGMGTEKDLQKAVRWFTKAAAIGELRSMNNLSYLYENGEGVPKDERLAERWYCLAGEISYGGDGVVKKGQRIEMIRIAG